MRLFRISTKVLLVQLGVDFFTIKGKFSTHAFLHDYGRERERERETERERQRERERESERERITFQSR